MDLTTLLWAVGVIVAITLLGRSITLRRQAEIDAKVEEYIQNNSKFIKIEKIEESAAPLYIAYNYLTNDFVTQGTTEEEVKINASLKWPKFDIFVVKVESQV